MTELTPQQWVGELGRMVASPAWPDLLPWFERALVARVMHDADPIARAIEASHELNGARALLLAIDNEVTTGDEYAKRAETARQRVGQQRAAQARSQGNGKRGTGAGGADAEPAGTA